MDLYAPYTGAGSGASASRRRTTGPISLGSHRAPLSSRGPCCQPSATERIPPSTSKTRPVTPADSIDPSQTTSGATFSGAITSNASSSGSAMVSANTASVMRVRAAGAIAFAVTPYRPSSADSTIVSAAMPALAALYAPWPTLPMRPAPDDVFTTRASTAIPDFCCSRQNAPAARVGAKCPLRCTRITASHSSSDVLTTIRSRRNPALFTSTSRPPNASIAVCTRCCAPCQSATSSPLATASPPIARIASTTSPAGPVDPPLPSSSAPRSLTTTFAPWRANSSACPRPMPRPAPVTMTTLPSQMPIGGEASGLDRDPVAAVGTIPRTHPTSRGLMRVFTHRYRAMPVATVLAAVVVLASACSSSSGAADRTPRSTTTTASPGVASHRAPDTPADVATRPPTAEEAALVAARPYTLHVPPQAKDPAPLVVVLHGYGATGATQAAYLGITPATDAQGMLLVTADGTLNAIQKRFWNATDACCAGRRTDVDDSAYLRAVIADVAAHHAIDPKRIYFVGHSNGGFMSYRMACDHADVVAAIVSLEAATWADAARCKPATAVSVLEIHGTADETIAYDGADIGGRTFPGAKKTVETWARYDGCRLTPDTPAPAPHAIEQDLPPATVTAYSTGCTGNGHAELWTQPDGVHIPQLAPDFADQVIAFLLAHPKR